MRGEQRLRALTILLYDKAINRSSENSGSCRISLAQTVFSLLFSAVLRIAVPTKRCYPLSTKKVSPMYSEDTPEPWRHGEDGCKGSEKNTPMFPAS